MTTVVNIKHYKGSYEYIGRGSIFGNIFKIGTHGNREQVIAAYKIWFYQKIEQDEGFKKAVHQLKGKVLGCFCKPQECHGDIIAEYLDNLQIFGSD